MSEHDQPLPDADAEVPAPQSTRPPRAPATDASIPLANAVGNPDAQEGQGEPAAAATLVDQVIQVLKGVFDPEIPVNIYELGLIYGIDADEQSGKVSVQMTLTSPACPVAGTLPGEVETRIKGLSGVSECTVDLVWDPPWTMEKLSEEARLQMGLL